MHHRHNEKKYNKGSKVLYTTRGITSEAVILDIHYDDALKPYYTIHILDDDREKQTDEDHITPITPIHQEFQEQDLNGASYPVKQRKGSFSYPIQERRRINNTFSHTEVSSSSDNEEECNTGNNISHESNLLTRRLNAQATLKPILRPSSFGDIPRNDCFDKNDEKNGTGSTECGRDYNDKQKVSDGNGSRTKLECEKKRWLDNESDENRPKRVRLDPKYASRDRTHRNAFKNTSAHHGNGPRQRKAPSLLRPLIDRRYFMRIKKKQRPERYSGQLRDKRVQTSNISRLNEDIFLSDRCDLSGANVFNNTSILYKEITAKARHLRRTKQRQKSLKRWEDLHCTNRSSHTKKQHQNLPTAISPTKKSNLSVPSLPDRNTEVEDKPVPAQENFSLKPVSTQTHYYDSAFASRHLSSREQKQSVYRPMVTFAPEKAATLKNYHFSSLHQNGGHNHIQKQLQTTWTDSAANDKYLPFHFMPSDGKATLNINTTCTSVARLILTPLAYLCAIFIRFMALVLNVFFAPTHTSCSQMESHQDPIPILSTPKIHQKRTPTIRSKRIETRPTELPKPNSHIERPRMDYSIHVKNPKELLPPVPSSWKSLFVLQPGEWRCSSCNFKNTADTLTCDICLAVKVDRARDEVNSSVAKEIEHNSPYAMSCDSSTTSLSLNLDDEIDNMFFMNNTPLNNDHSDLGLEIGDGPSLQTHQDTIIATSAPKKRITDLGDSNESNLKRSGIDNSNLVDEHLHQQDGGDAGIRKRATVMSDNQFTSKRSHIAFLEKPNTIEDMDISPNKSRQ